MLVGAKFRLIRKAKRLTLVAVMKQLGLKSTGYLSEIENGKKDPSDTLINNLVMTYGISGKWWETGEGPIFIERDTLDRPTGLIGSAGIPRRGEEIMRWYERKTAEMSEAEAETALDLIREQWSMIEKILKKSKAGNRT